MLRKATVEDHLAISILITTDSDDSGPAQRLAAMREQGDIALELVSEGEHGLRTHIVFVELVAPKGVWLVQRPTVRGARQGQGYGKESMYLGLQQARAAGALAIMSLDVDYFSGFDFSTLSAENLTLPLPHMHASLYPIAPESGHLEAEVTFPTTFLKVAEEAL